MTEPQLTLLEAMKGPKWRRLLIEALAELGSKQRIATRLGISRTYVSRVMTGSINPPPQAFVNRVIYRLEVVHCPHTLQQQPRDECRSALQPAPTHNPYRLALWQVCQSCTHKPESKKEQ
jgi:hypothetical protein